MTLHDDDERLHAPPDPLPGNWQENTVNTNTRAYHTVRIDHELNDRTKIFGRFILTPAGRQPDRLLQGLRRGRSGGRIDP